MAGNNDGFVVVTDWERAPSNQLQKKSSHAISSQSDVSETPLWENAHISQFDNEPRGDTPRTVGKSGVSEEHITAPKAENNMLPVPLRARGIFYPWLYEVARSFLSPDADLSTMPHKSAHIFLRDYKPWRRLAMPYCAPIGRMEFVFLASALCLAHKRALNLTHSYSYRGALFWRQRQKGHQDRSPPLF